MRSRLLRLMGPTVFVGLAACTAIAGLDGEFVQDPGVDGSVVPEASTDSGQDANKGDGGAQEDAETADRDSASADAQPDTSPPVFIEIDGGVPASTTSSAKGFCAGKSGPFCFDFDGNSALPHFGWNFGDPDAGTGLTVVDEGSGQMVLRAKLDNTAPSASLLSYITSGPRPPSEYGTGTNMGDKRGLKLTFKFRVVSADKYAVIGALDFYGQKLGLAVLPDRCQTGGTKVLCLGENVEVGRVAGNYSPTAFAINAWYQAELSVYRVTSGWTSTLSVGGRTVATHVDNAMPLTNKGTRDTDPYILVSVGGADSTANGEAELIVDEPFVTTIYAENL